MKKAAIFVEGHTELAFIRRFVIEIAGSKNIAIKDTGSGSAQNQSQIRILSEPGEPRASRFFILIHNSSGDSRVLSDMRDQAESLRRAGYAMMAGLRDVRPKSRDQIGKIRSASAHHLQRLEPVATMILAVMEIEAWFLAEHTHFLKIHNKLTPSYIKEKLGFDPKDEDMSSRDRPSNDLRAVYGLAGMSYDKRAHEVSQVVTMLDYAPLYLTSADRNPDLAGLVNWFDRFLDS